MAILAPRLAGLRIGSRLALALAPPILLLLGTACTGLWRLESLNEEFTRIVGDRHAKIDLLNEIVVENYSILKAGQGALLAVESEEVGAELGRIAAVKRNLAGLLERLDRAFRDESREANALLQSVHDQHTAYLVDLVRFTRLVEAGRSEEARGLLNSRLKGKLDDAFRAMRRLSAFQTRATERSVAAAADSYTEARDLTIALSLLSVALAIVIGIWAARAIIGPIGRAVRVAERVASGNLSGRIEVRGRDEAAVLMSALGSMTQGLAGIVRDVRDSSDVIARAAGHLVAANDNLCERTSEQAAAIEQASAAMQEFTGSAARSAEGARLASDIAVSAAGVATRGEQAVARMVATMESISTRSRKVADIVGFIDRVAFQTHLLAVNAAVEAARAGAEGRGFAAIATEVRDLASFSAKAAKDIRALIVEASAEVEHGTALAGEAGRTMLDILASAQEVDRILADISLQAEGQRSGIEQMNQMLGGMERTTQSGAAVVEEISAAMRVLESEARRLVDMVLVFELGEAEMRPAAPTARSGQLLPRMSVRAAASGAQP